MTYRWAGDPQPIRRLDLGGTACYDSSDAVACVLDASISDEEWNEGTQTWDSKTCLIQGDYNRMPFPKEYFDEAYGSCYLEERHSYHELFRVLKHGGRATVSACGDWYFEELAAQAHRWEPVGENEGRVIEPTINPNVESVPVMTQYLFDQIGTEVARAVRAGFRVRVEVREAYVQSHDCEGKPGEIDLVISTPLFRLRKP